jgi:hypothetical protein
LLGHRKAEPAEPGVRRSTAAKLAVNLGLRKYRFSRVHGMKRLSYVVAILVLLIFGGFYYRSETARQREASEARRHVLDLTRGSDGVCEIHQVQMERRTVEINYGLHAELPWYSAKFEHAGGSQNFLALQKVRFPHALDQAFGGCVITDSSPTKAVIPVCPECTRELIAWQKEKPTN